MWDSLKRDDIDQAKQQLALRRADIVRRHADEIGRLDGDRSELETLNRLADAFAQKYKDVRTVPSKPLAPKVAGNNSAHTPAPETQPPDQRIYGQSNFDTFARAVSKSAF